MAKATSASTNTYNTPKVSRPGVHDKSKSSKLKSSKNYKKAYGRQGR